MTLKDIAINNLKRRKSKALFVLAGLLIGVSTVVALVTLVQAMKRDINHKLEMYGANILILPRTENLPLTYGGLSLGGVSFDMKEIHQEELTKIKSIKNAGNVAAVGPIVLGPVHAGDHRILMAGVDFGASPFLRPWWNLKGVVPEENEVILGSEAAHTLGLGKDSTAMINGKAIAVTGVLEPTGSQDDNLVFTRVATAQKVLGKDGIVSMAEVAALCNACPIDQMVKQISDVLPEANVMAIQQIVKGRMETLDYFQKFSYGVSALVLFVGSLMVLITMMGSVKERTIEIGIFRAMGFRRAHIMRIIFLEAGIISFLAGAMGYGIGVAATKILAPYFMERHHPIAVSFDPFIAGLALVASIALGLLATIYPAMLASRLDPNEALRAL
jgi:putative ABC transport system permease protein